MYSILGFQLIFFDRSTHLQMYDECQLYVEVEVEELFDVLSLGVSGPRPVLFLLGERN